MAIQAKKQSSWFVILLIVAAVAIWAIDQKKETSVREPGSDRKITVPSKPAPPRETGRKSSPTTEPAGKKGRYEVFRNCTLAADRANDGDSFRVQLPDGRKEIFRLYFVDTPESDFKSYRNGENNHDRIREQAAYFGISPEEAVKIGQEGKHFTMDLLGKRPFTLYTEWDSPFRDQRYHAFIEVSSGGKNRWLHEVLIEKGFVRLKTKPAELPDGTSVQDQKKRLETMERSARAAKAGGWE